MLKEFKGRVGYETLEKICSSVSCAKFSNDGRRVLSRDFMKLTVWDVRKPDDALMFFPVHEYIKPILTKLHESENIFGKFDCDWTSCGKFAVSGSYNDTILKFDVLNGTRSCICTKEPKEKRLENVLKFPFRRFLRCQCHPSRSLVAGSNLRELYLFSERSTHTKKYFENN